MIIAADYVQLVGHGVFCADRHHLQDIVAEPVHAERQIVDVGVVERRAARANEVAGDIGESSLGIAGRAVADVFVAGEQVFIVARQLSAVHGR